jgi:hypothetical protein
LGLVFTVGNMFNGAVFAVLIIAVVLLLPDGLVGLFKGGGRSSPTTLLRSVFSPARQEDR